MGAYAKVVRRHYVDLPKKVAGPSHVKVGFPAGKAVGDVINHAVWNEFGTRGGGWGGPIPERPFMRNAMRNNEGAYKSALRVSAVKILRGQTSLSTVMQKLGILAQGDIQKEITSLSSPPNSPVTIALKGSSKPLIDTGEMFDAVTYKVDQ